MGVLGGTFDPIHNGHLSLALSALKEQGLDFVWIMPSAVSYLKEGTGVSPAEDRLAMCRLAVEGRPELRVSELEIQRGGFTYTYETMEELNRLYPQTEHYFIMGADSLFFMENWKHAERIFAACRILAAVREDLGREKLLGKIRELQERFQAEIYLLPMEPVGISSSLIRKEASEGHPIGAYVPRGVEEYIKTLGLYTHKEA
ncbi:MAG: nicotinate-nucleotide adenylyltransferase [Lachnospiraceae bacterium]|nr:nicotinate-nucleotide adenylyltransferase [Lachnospiraceae bacterium]